MTVFREKKERKTLHFLSIQNTKSKREKWTQKCREKRQQQTPCDIPLCVALIFYCQLIRRFDSIKYTRVERGDIYQWFKCLQTKRIKNKCDLQTVKKLKLKKGQKEYFYNKKSSKNWCLQRGKSQFKEKNLTCHCLLDYQKTNLSFENLAS